MPKKIKNKNSLIAKKITVLLKFNKNLLFGKRKEKNLIEFSDYFLPEILFEDQISNFHKIFELELSVR